MGADAIEEAVIARLRQLQPSERNKVLEFARHLPTEPSLPLRSLEGLWANRGVDISESDLADLRREMWDKFPRNAF